MRVLGEGLVFTVVFLEVTIREWQPCYNNGLVTAETA